MICTGSLILAAAGLLTGRPATTHWLGMDELKRLGADPTSERVVFDGKYVTAASVSSGIDMALTLAGRIAGAGCPGRQVPRPQPLPRHAVAFDSRQTMYYTCGHDSDTSP